MSEDGVRWVRVSRGFYLLGFGTFLLLTTQGLLPPGFWGRVIAYWPVLLVAIGLRLVFERGPAPWLVLLGPILVLGTMACLAMRGPGRLADGDWTEVRVERPRDLASFTFEGHLALAGIDVESKNLKPGVLVEGKASESGRGSVQVSEDVSAGRVRVSNFHKGDRLMLLPGAHRARAEVGVTTALPMAIDLDLALTSTRFDVADTRVSGVSFDGAFNDLSLRLGKPASDVRLDLDGSFNRITIEVPSGIAVRVSSDGFLNSVDRGIGSRDGAAGAPEYRVRLDGAFNRVVVRPG